MRTLPKLHRQRLVPLAALILACSGARQPAPAVQTAPVAESKAPPPAAEPPSTPADPPAIAPLPMTPQFSRCRIAAVYSLVKRWIIVCL